MQKFLGIAILGFLAISLVFVKPAQAQLSGAVTNLEKGVGTVGLTPKLDDTISTIIKAVLGTLGMIFFGLTIYAGVLWMTAAGNEEAITKAKNIVEAAVIGLVITLSAYAITNFVSTRLSKVENQAASPGPATCVGNDGECVGQNTCGRTIISPYDCTGNTPVCCKK